MVGRGTRIDIETNKLMFRVYDYTDATRLFGEDFVSKPHGVGGDGPEPPPPPPPEPTVVVDGFDVRIADAGRAIVTEVDGKAMPVSVEEYKSRLAARLIEEAHTLDDLRAIWIEPPGRRSPARSRPGTSRRIPQRSVRQRRGQDVASHAAW